MKIAFFSISLPCFFLNVKMTTTKKALLGLDIEELRTLTANLGMPRFAAGQIAAWLYKKRVKSIDEMTNLSLKHREILKEKYEIGRTTPIESVHSVDGTIKYLFQVGVEGAVEAVYIPAENGERATLCISSQVGCKMNCRFCMTGKQGFTANLTTGEILNQLLSIPESDTLTNVVMMGMGEPFDNIDAVLKALKIMTAEYGFAWSPKRITVSTVGIKQGMKRFLHESDCHLAISLHNPFPTERYKLMPAEKAFSITEMTELLREYDFSHQRRLSFEYIVFKGINDTLAHAQGLIQLLRGMECRINLIRFHAIPGVDLQGTTSEEMIAFRDYLTNHGIFTTIRASRGEDIYAACGMLSTAHKEA